MIRGLLVGCLVLGVAGCSFDGEPIFKDGEGPSIDVLGKVEDSAPLTVRVKKALRNNAQTSLARIQISSPSDDTIKLSGFVDNDATRYEAERVAGNVSGVRHVVNNIDVIR
ncbi:MAG: BON domain-containing protein [Granulosicoccus sp.]